MSMRALAPEWHDLPAIKAFTLSRKGGVSKAPFDSLNPATHVGDDPGDVAVNRSLLQTLLPDALQWQWLEQVHGTSVITASEAIDPVQADGIITMQPGLACCVLTADCLPIFLASETMDEVALLHGGWRGLAADIIAAALARMKTSPARLRAWLGPAIGPCHFEVGADVCAAFTGGDSAIDFSSAFTPAPTQGKFMADLYQLARLQLQAQGVTAVSGGEHCSYCDSEQFYSYRRDGRTGRNLSVIYLQP